MTTQPVNHPLPLPVKEPDAPTCAMPYLDWQGHTWSCCLPPNHMGDHYAEEGKAWCWYGLDARREAINKANGIITRHLQPFDGGPCGCGWPGNGLPYAPSHQAHVAERMWDAGCLAG